MKLFSKFTPLFIIPFCFITQTIFAHCECPLPKEGCDLFRTYCCHPFFLSLELGSSHSRKADIHVDNSFWDISPDGYNSDLESSETYAAGFGYQPLPGFSADVSVTRRPSFDYSKFQTSTSTSTPGFLGNKTRFFEFNNTSIMFNLTLYSSVFSPCFHWNMGSNIWIQPFISAGAGVAYNTVEDFHSVLGNPPIEVLDPIGAIMAPQTESNFAWQFVAGIELAHCNRVSVDLGYRYFDGGEFKSNDYLVDVLSGGTTPVVSPPWKGEFRSNEVFIKLKYAL